MKNILFIAIIFIGALMANAADAGRDVVIRGEHFVNITAVAKTNPTTIMISCDGSLGRQNLLVDVEEVPKPFLSAWNIEPPKAISIRKIEMKISEMPTIAQVLSCVGIVLFIWIVIRQILAAKRTNFAVPIIGQIFIVLVGSFLSLCLAIAVGFLLGFHGWDHDWHAISNPNDIYVDILACMLLVGGVSGSILFACKSKKYGE